MLFYVIYWSVQKSYSYVKYGSGQLFFLAIHQTVISVLFTQMNTLIYSLFPVSYPIYLQKTLNQIKYVLMMI